MTNLWIDFCGYFDLLPSNMTIEIYVCATVTYYVWKKICKNAMLLYRKKNLANKS